MKLTIDLPVEVFEALVTHAIHEHRPTPHQAAYLLVQWVRERQPACEICRSRRAPTEEPQARGAAQAAVAGPAEAHPLRGEPRGASAWPSP